MKLQFARTAEDAVEACFVCQPVHEGYAGILHGGAICAVLDGAMTNWLFAHGCIAVTADLRVRFRHPVAVGRPAVVRARLERTQRPVHCLKAELVQDQRVAATAVGRFMEKDGPRCFGDDHASRT